MSVVYISLGSNLGDKRQHLDIAIQLLRQRLDDQLKRSRFYETDPVGYLDQGPFLNCCVRLDTQLKPVDVLAVCQQIEQDLHRKRLMRWGPRTIDLDIILFDDVHFETETLIIPHPRYKERAFVLAPLLDVYDGIEKEELLLAYEAVKHQNIRVSADE